MEGKMADQFKNQVVLITGGAFGIGRATALAFAREGAKVIVTDLCEEGASETCQLIIQEGGQACALRCDVTDTVDVQATFSAILTEFNRLDCAFNNAGTEGEFNPLVEASDENFDHVIAVNLKGVWLCMKVEIRNMRKQRSGAIVNTASVAGLVAERGYPAYAAAKGGVIQLTRTAAIENASTGVRINAICPGMVRTPMLERSMHNMRASRMTYGDWQSPAASWFTDTFLGTDPMKKLMLKFLQPVGRPGEPEEIAAAVLYLCSEPAKFVTGQTLVLDGGMTAQ
jgi:NAD(P)-dependent dehydrogenase (short-subunit alcohol dehydrogenase family)